MISSKRAVCSYNPLGVRFESEIKEVRRMEVWGEKFERVVERGRESWPEKHSRIIRCPLEFGGQKFIRGQTALIHDNLEQTCLFRSSVEESSLSNISRVEIFIRLVRWKGNFLKADWKVEEQLNLSVMFKLDIEMKKGKG